MLNKTADTQLTQILSYFPYHELPHLATVCKRWKRLTGENYIWKAVFASVFPLYKLPDQGSVASHFRAQVLACRAMGLPKMLSLNVQYKMTFAQVVKYQISQDNRVSDIDLYKGSIFSTITCGGDKVTSPSGEVSFSEMYTLVERHLIHDLPPVNQIVEWPGNKVMGLYIRRADGLSDRPDLKDYKFEFFPNSSNCFYRLKMIKLNSLLPGQS